MSEDNSIPFGRPWITDEDRQAVMDVLNGPILTHGPKCEGFEKDFAQFMEGGHSVTTSSCTASLHLFYMHLGIGAGDEVILPSISHVATAHSLEITGARPVFVDCLADTGNVDPDLLEAAITPATKAICIVHFNGIPADMDRVMAVANKHNLPVLEDCATGLGAKWNGVHVGLFGDGAGFSFYPAKHITAGEGGMFSSRLSDVTGAVRRLRAFCYDRSLNERALPGIYDVDGLGLNYRMSEMQAALGQSQLKRIGEMLDIRTRNFSLYKERMSDIEDVTILESTDPKGTDAHYCLTVMLSGAMAARRNDMLAGLKDAGVGVSVHYPHPLPRLKYYREKYGYDETHFQNAAAISDCSLNLPVAPHIDGAAVERICNTFSSLVNEFKK